MSISRIAVALPLPIHKVFTYSLPSYLRTENIIGCRVLVPFGKQVLTGVIVDEAADMNTKEVKEILELLDDEPVFSSVLRSFIKWVADYYMASYGETLKAALPTGMSPHSIITVHITRFLSDDELVQMARRAPKRALLYSFLKEKSGEVSISYLQKNMGGSPITEQLEALQSAGYIEINKSVEQDIKPKKQKAVGLSEHLRSDSELLRSVLDELDRKAPKQALIISHVYIHSRQSDVPYLVTELIEFLHVSESAIAALVKKGYLFQTEVEISRIKEEPEVSLSTRNEELLELSPQQQHALHKIEEAIAANFHKTFLLHGVTGSGKTLVYIHAIRYTLAVGKTALILVPEVALTPQLIDRFRMAFGEEIAVLHSKMAIGERFDNWRKIHKGTVRLVIGARSAIFAPLPNIGLIIVDEEHEPSYKQDDPAPRYQARDCAVIRGSMEKAIVVLGSATPSMESYFNAQMGKYHLLEITGRADNAQLPDVRIINMIEHRKRKAFQKSFSNELLEAIAQRLQVKEGIILFQNRRGFASRLECPDCGHVPECKNCSVALTYHKKAEMLRCHYCGYAQEAPRACTVCGSLEINDPGSGTQRVEEELAEILTKQGFSPNIARMDLDTTSRRGSHRKLLQDFAEGKTDILIGTQMVAKGLDFGRVTLVGVINADLSLFMPDFRASERTYQLLTQVAGRAGRTHEKKGSVIIQTNHAEHQAIFAAAVTGYHHFYSDELQMRKQALYPPFARFISIEFSGGDEHQVHDHAHRFAGLLPKGHNNFFHIGPTPPTIVRLRNKYRRLIIIKNIKILDPTGEQVREHIRHAITTYNQKFAHRNVHFTVDIDSFGIM